MATVHDGCSNQGGRRAMGGRQRAERACVDFFVAEQSVDLGRHEACWSGGGVSGWDAGLAVWELVVWGEGVDVHKPSKPESGTRRPRCAPITGEGAGLQPLHAIERSPRSKGNLTKHDAVVRRANSEKTGTWTTIVASRGRSSEKEKRARQGSCCRFDYDATRRQSECGAPLVCDTLDSTIITRGKEPEQLSVGGLRLETGTTVQYQLLVSLIVHCSVGQSYR